MKKYICIHGHFYQPPRENPWLESIEMQDSAYPYHDWNEKITSECYAANASSRILDPEGRIVRIANNYSRISFNIGPTLLSWMEKECPDVYRRILAADKQSLESFDGHGSAMAQAYNHIIMPLANDRDRKTQVRWGVADFRHRFGREPEGMWLPETAVDIPTLEALAAEGIKFTILEPGQAKRIKRIGPQDEWKDISGGRIDPTRPYQQKLPSGRKIAVFFYDGPASRAVAFEQLLDSGERFAGRLVGLFDKERTWPQIVHIATDGETYGHHHRHGDMALAYALKHIEEEGLAQLTNYSQYLALHPPTYQVDIVENTAWSCAHGVGRWKKDCGCNIGGREGWNQKWRDPLRKSLDWLRDAVWPVWETSAREFFEDPWAARDDYISVVLDRSAQSLSAFLKRNAEKELDSNEVEQALGLLELQRHAMLMYTSCGWFFDDISGIETVQIMAYAGRVVQLAKLYLGIDLEEPFLERLAKAKSNIPSMGNGMDIYGKFLVPARVDLQKVGAHYAISSLFQDYGESSHIYCYRSDRQHEERVVSGRAKLIVGRIAVTSEITTARDQLSFGAIHFGDHNAVAGVRTFGGEDAYNRMLKDVNEAFQRADFPEAVRRLDRHFGTRVYSLESLFRDEQRRIIDVLLDSTLEEAERAYRTVYTNNVALMRYVIGLGAPLPRALRTAAEFVWNLDLRRSFEADHFDIEATRKILDETESWGLRLDLAGLKFALETSIERIAARVRDNPDDEDLLERFKQEALFMREIPIDVDLGRTQNTYGDLLEEIYPDYYERAKNNDDELAARWVEAVRLIGDYLKVLVH